MTKPSTVFKAGTRGSRLALLQTNDALERIGRLLPRIRFETVILNTPGDRDRARDLRESPPDFFSRDLDAAVRSGQLDCAIHSAKDFPDPAPEGLDWCWLPWREDPRDAIVLAPGRRMEDLTQTPTIGVSSRRREDYCRRRFPYARLEPIRGNIEERLAQLDVGKYDLIIMAAAALLRLGLANRLAERIPVEALPPLQGQGYLAFVFRRDDRRLQRVRSLFTPAVVFVGAGAGSAAACTMAGIEALRRAEVCLFDSLMDPALLNELPSDALRIDVGKRAGNHTQDQEQITDSITRYARQGRRMVRAKGGDPGIFGRLAEETEALDALRLPYRVIPGISSLQAATTGTGMLLTRRGVSRGFCVMSSRVRGGDAAPVGRAERAQLPLVIFMGVSVAAQTAHGLIGDGLAPQTPAAMVFDAGGDNETVVRAPLESFADSATDDAAEVGKALAKHGRKPGLFLVGDITSYAFVRSGALEGRRVLLTCSEGLQARAADRVRDFGGIPVQRPLIRLVPRPEAADMLAGLAKYDWIVLTSPAAVGCFAAMLRAERIDLRKVPRVMVSGTGTAAALESDLGLQPELEPSAGFGGEALIEAAGPRLKSGARVLRIRSDNAGPGLAEALRTNGAEVTDCVLYTNEAVHYDEAPDFDAVWFASASAVDEYVRQWHTGTLKGKTVLAIGQPTTRRLSDHRVSVDVLSPEATVDDAIAALAAFCVNADVDA